MSDATHPGVSSARVDDGKKHSLDRKWLQNLVKNDIVYATAPMIEQSDTAFRILTRRYGANLCYTPMIHATTFLKKTAYRNKMFRLNDDDDDAVIAMEDRPLIAQIAGANKEALVECAKLLEPYVDAIDLNLGCPTLTAKRGRYGAYLLGSGPYVVDLVRHLVDNLSCPVTCKVRLLPPKRPSSQACKTDETSVTPPPPSSCDLQASLDLYRALIDAGASMLTVHGRTKDMKGEATGKADWDAIRSVVQELGHRVPILANGNLSCWRDVCDCLEYTKADGVMSSEAILEYPPALYHPSVVPPPDPSTRPGPGRLAIAREYLELCRTYPPEQRNGASGMQCLCMHLNTFLHADLVGNTGQDRDDDDRAQLRESIASSRTLEDLFRVLDRIEQRHQQACHDVSAEQLCWYYRHW